MPPKTPATKKKPPAGDTTSTARAMALLDRLAQSKGKRVVVDFYAEEREALDALVAAGYAPNQSEVLRKAVIEVRKRKKA